MWALERTASAGSSARSALDLVFPGSAGLPQVGVYGDGILTVLDENDGREFLRSWEWLVGRGSVALLATGFGDVFFWAGQKVNWLNVQSGTVEQIDPDVVWFLETFLIDERVTDKVLRTEQLAKLVRKTRALEYLEAFILTPWLILGGVDDPENYSIGHCGVYVDLVGQTLSQLFADGA